MIKRIIELIQEWSIVLKDCFYIASAIITLLASLETIAGFSLINWSHAKGIFERTLVLSSCFTLLYLLVLIAKIWRNRKITIKIKDTIINIYFGDLLKVSQGMVLINCDSCFDTRVNDDVIKRKSLHGQYIKKIENTESLKKTIAEEAKKRKLKKNPNETNKKYSFPLGTIIKYKHGGLDYLLLSTTKLDKENQARINFNDYQAMLKRMWMELERYYSGNDISIPLLCGGTARFTDCHICQEMILFHLLDSYKRSDANIKSTINVILSKKSFKKSSFSRFKIVSYLIETN